MIYRWLSEEERNQLLMELYGENVRNIAELSPQLRFFRLLHFIEVRFIRVGKWVSRIAELLENISSENSDLFIEDLIFKDANDEDVRLFELREELREVKPQSAFEDLLRQLEFKEDYERYMSSSQVRRRE
ncbi:MAG: hypothetical protein JSV12_07020 [Candidatus Bathyarchaeota archaeon]|nr:MAG: hypothetical protein JSV12_07020 [Candidatus Bathyarchaeota archaeon]